ESLRDRILIRLDTEGISYSLSANGTIINVENQQTARRARAILVREGLTPQNLDPWHLFDVNRWTTNQFLDNVNLQRSLTESLRQHIESLNDIDQAMVNLAVPRDRLFLQDQDPITVSVVITARPGSDITTNMHKIRGLNDLIQFAIPGLQADNITITDSFTGRRINDFAAYDIQSRLEQADIIRRQKEAEERDYLNRFRRQLSGMLSPDRIGFVNIEITNNTNQITRTGREITPIEITPQDPTAPFNTREVVHSILISEGAANVTFRGTGFNPEGPAGFEAQTPPAYQDLQNTTGFYDQSTFQRNFDTNVTEFEEIVSPSRRENIAVSVALDGTWTFDLNEDGTPVMLPDGSRSRTYHPIPAAELAQFQSLLEAAVNFDLASGDMVRVVNIQFDRTAQFMMEDEAFRRQLLVGNIIRFGGFGLLGLAVLFIAYRLVVRERERRRRAREEELARQHAAMREAALRSLEQEQAEAEINPIDQARATAQDHAMAMAREHPEEVAQLIKTWLSEES
ncbi:MAG: flagellar M-ring protein FliF, partial [Spirochaetaceae bacterium]|nr:flagellar M-ring protein FliF [Spirochaetaceae bacterium]